MKLVRKSDITPISPHGDSKLYRYDALGYKDVGIVCSEQGPHTVREGPSPVENVMYLLSGKLTIHVEGRKDVEIGPGDAVAFRGGEDRKIYNNSDEAAVMLLLDHPGGPIAGPGGPGGPGPGGPGGPDDEGPGGPGGPGPGGPGGPDEEGPGGPQ